MRQLKSIYYPFCRKIACRKISCGKISHQQGAVLITSLVMLVILTLLGLSTMTNSSLQERMAANSQEISRSFHIADSALSTAFDDANSLDTSRTVQIDLNNTWGNNVSTIATARYSSRFTGTTPLGRGRNLSQLWGSDFGRYHFELQSIGTTNSEINTVLNSGVVQIGPIQ